MKLDARKWGPRKWVSLAAGMALLGGRSGLAHAQQEERHVTGHVVDADTRRPVTAAVVLVTGTAIATTTNDSGAFAIRIPASATTLTVRRIGYQQAPVTLASSQDDYTIAVTKDVLQLETQVITGVATTASS